SKKRSFSSSKKRRTWSRPSLKKIREEANVSPKPILKTSSTWNSTTSLLGPPVLPAPGGGSGPCHVKLIRLSRQSDYERIDTLISMPRQTRMESTLLPPYENRGSVIPTTGKSPIDMPRLKAVCQKMMDPHPTARAAPKRSLA